MKRMIPITDQVNKELYTLIRFKIKFLQQTAEWEFNNCLIPTLKVVDPSLKSNEIQDRSESKKNQVQNRLNLNLRKRTL